jgi:hypothetical protein
MDVESPEIAFWGWRGLGTDSGAIATDWFYRIFPKKVVV